jgi:hypothetical protein
MLARYLVENSTSTDQVPRSRQRMEPAGVAGEAPLDAAGAPAGAPAEVAGGLGWEGYGLGPAACPLESSGDGAAEPRSV